MVVVGVQVGVYWTSWKADFRESDACKTFLGTSGFSETRFLQRSFYEIVIFSQDFGCIRPIFEQWVSIFKFCF